MSDPGQIAEAAASAHPFFDFYSASLRGPLFTGFLTAGSFLLAMTTATLGNMRQFVFHTPEYRASVAKKRRVKKSISAYGPLQRLCGFLLGSIILAVITSVSQLSIGLIRADWAAYVCLSLAFLTAFVLSVTLVLIGLNMSLVFREWEKEANELIAREHPPEPPADTRRKTA